MRQSNRGQRWILLHPTELSLDNVGQSFDDQNNDHWLREGLFKLRSKGNAVEGLWKSLENSGVIFKIINK